MLVALVATGWASVGIIGVSVFIAVARSAGQLALTLLALAALVHVIPYVNVAVALVALCFVLT